MDRLELAARQLLAMVKAGGEPDLTALEAALEPDPTPICAFKGDEPAWIIPAGQEGTRGLRVVFAEDGVGFIPIGFPGGFSLSYQAAYNLRYLLEEKLEAAGVYTATEEGSCFDPADYNDRVLGEEYEPSPDIETEQALDIEAANRQSVIDLAEALRAGLAVQGSSRAGSASLKASLGAIEAALPQCAVCCCPFEPEEEGQTECDPTGCPGRYGDVEPIDS